MDDVSIHKGNFQFNSRAIMNNVWSEFARSYVNRTENGILFKIYFNRSKIRSLGVSGYDFTAYLGEGHLLRRPTTFPCCD